MSDEDPFAGPRTRAQDELEDPAYMGRAFPRSRGSRGRHSRTFGLLLLLAVLSGTMALLNLISGNLGPGFGASVVFIPSCVALFKVAKRDIGRDLDREDHDRHIYR
jgi:hypothetical protein